MRKILVIAVAGLILATASGSPAVATQRIVPAKKPATVASLEKRLSALERQAPAAPGPKGDTGPQGPQGPAGLPGKDGQSIVGPVGPQGQQGLPGKDGAAGKAGADGATGPAGPAGPVGPAGEPGKDGKGLPSGTLILVGGSCPAGTTLEGRDYGWRVYSGNPFTGTGSELWITACRIN